MDDSVKSLVYETPLGNYKIPVGTEVTEENTKRASEMVERLYQFEVERVKSINHLEEERVKSNAHLEEVRTEAEARVKEKQAEIAKEKELTKRNIVATCSNPFMNFLMGLISGNEQNVEETSSSCSSGLTDEEIKNLPTDLQ